MSDYKLGDFSKAQDKHDEFLEKQYPNVPLSLMRDIYEIHNSFNQEQQDDFMNATITSNWREYDIKYNLNQTDLQYDNYDMIFKTMEIQQEEYDLELKTKNLNVEEIE